MEWTRPLKTLLVQLQNDEFQNAYDSSFRFAAAFVRNLKWAGLFPNATCPPAWTRRPERSEHVAGGSVRGYYIRRLFGVPGAGGECCLKAQLARQRYRRAACGGARAWRLCGMVRVNWRADAASLQTADADRPCARLVEVMFELRMRRGRICPRSWTSRPKRRCRGSDAGANRERRARRSRSDSRTDDSPGWRALARAAGVALENNPRDKRQPIERGEDAARSKPRRPHRTHRYGQEASPRRASSTRRLLSSAKPASKDKRAKASRIRPSLRRVEAYREERHFETLRKTPHERIRTYHSHNRPAHSAKRGRGLRCW